MGVFLLLTLCIVGGCLEAGRSNVALLPAVAATVVGWPGTIGEFVVFLSTSVAKFALPSFVPFVARVFRATVGGVAVV